LKRKSVATALVAVACAAAMWLIVWPAFGPYLVFTIPLPGTSKIVSASVRDPGDAAPVVSVQYFFTGRPDGAYITLALDAEENAPPGVRDQGSQWQRRAIRGEHAVNIDIQRPSIEDEITTTRVKLRLMSPDGSVLDEKAISAFIAWPNQDQWEVKNEVAAKPPDVVLKKASALIDAGDTRSLVRGKLLVEELIRRDPHYAAAIEQRIRVASLANWEKQGLMRLDTWKKIFEETNALELEHAYAILEELAHNLNESKALTEDGYPALAVFHRAFNGDLYQMSAIPPDRLAVLESAAAIASLQTPYSRKFPNSPVTRLRIAAVLTLAAWQIRGDGTANTVTPEQWVRTKALLAKALDQLMQCKAECDKDPAWYASTLSVMRLSSAPREDIARIFLEGFQKYPDFGPISWEMATALSPKWGGSPEAVEAFARQLASQFPKAERDVIYARLYSELALRGDALWSAKRTDLKVDCRRWIGGFGEHLARFPSNHNLNVAAVVSVNCGDKAGARKYMQRIGNEPDPRVWNLDDFANAAAWAK
jgi:hypothetical protein